MDSNTDLEHLKLLPVFYYVVAVLIAIVSSFALLHLAIGVGLATGWEDMGGQEPVARWMGWFFIAISSILLLAGWAIAICTALTGRYLSQYRRYTFCLVTAGVICMIVPFGTVLGIFTLILLRRDPVIAHFKAQAAGLEA